MNTTTEKATLLTTVIDSKFDRAMNMAKIIGYSVGCLKSISIEIDACKMREDEKTEILNQVNDYIMQIEEMWENR